MFQFDSARSDLRDFSRRRFLRTGITLLAVLAATLASRCSDDTVTEPEVRVTPTAGPSADLRGTWTGTVRGLGASDDYFCPGRQRDATVQLLQSGSGVSFTFPLDGCSRGGDATFTGNLAGTILSGTANRVEGSTCALLGQMSGTAEASHLVLEGRLRGSCNDVIVHVELAR